MTYHNLSKSETNSTGILDSGMQTPFEIGMISWAEWTTLILGILIIIIEFAQVIQQALAASYVSILYL